MRRSILVGGFVATFVLAVAGPASAQERLRDPFDPLVDTNADTTTTTTTTTDPAIDTTAPDTDPAVDPDDGLPTTGVDPRSWLAFAYVLIACGGGLLILARTHRTGPLRPGR